MKKLIIIPAFNEESNIEKTVTSIQKNAAGLNMSLLMIVPEIIQDRFARTKAIT